MKKLHLNLQSFFAIILIISALVIGSPTDFVLSQEATDSATARQSAKVLPLPKHDYSANEDITAKVINTKDPDLKTTLLDNNGKEVPIPINKEVVGEETVLQIAPDPAFKPGKYTLKVTDSNGKESAQDFTWGVLAININKSIYLPNEQAKLSLAVLDEAGMMVCDAKLKLKVKSEKLKVEDELTTENGKIAVNPECQIHDYTEKPDYEASYQVKEQGRYEMVLTAETKNGSYTITDSFEVRDDVKFDVERNTATRIYPFKKYPVTFHITANQDFEGEIRETVPKNFEIFPAIDNRSYDEIKEQGEEKIIIWKTALKKDEKISLGYLFKAPAVSPQFYLLGPVKFIDTNSQVIFQETRKWQMASDSITLSGSGNWTAPATGTISIQCWGGGGAGGGQNQSSDGGGGGGGGAYAKVNAFDVVLNQTYPYEVGSGGTGVASSKGNDGGVTFFSTYTGRCYALGGTGGSPSTGTPPSGGAGGVGASGTGDVKYSGGQGEIGRDHAQGYGGYGGSSAGTASDGYSGPQSWSTETYPTGSTPTGAGHGGDGGATNVNGSAPASGYGGGGGGSGEGTAMVGGNGANGTIIINYLSTVALNTPTDTQTIYDTTPTFDFTGTDVDSDNIEYNIQISSNPTSPVFDNASSAYMSSASTTLTWSHTIGSGSNRILIVGIAMRAVLATGVTYNGVALTKIRNDTSADDRNSELWYLPEASLPATGAYDVVVTGSVSQQWMAGAISYSNTSGLGNDVGDTSVGSATSSSITLTTNSYEVVIDVLAMQGTNTIVADGSQNQRWNLTGPVSTGGGSTKTATGTSTVMAWTFGNDQWAASAVALRPVAFFDKNSVDHVGFVNPNDGFDIHPFQSGSNIQFTVQPADALALGTYYWSVRGKDPFGTNIYGPWSATRSFTLVEALITTGTTGDQVSSMNIPSTGNYVGGAFTFVRNYSSATVSQIVVTETGSVDANLNLSNLKLYSKQEATCSSSIPADAGFLGRVKNFNASEKATVPATWGTNGMVTYDSGGIQTDMVEGTAIDSDGSVYVAGYQQTNGFDWVMLKYDSAGVLDTTWGTNGKVTYDYAGGADVAWGVAIDSNRNIYAAGRITGTNGYDWAVRKYDSGGVLDTTWGTNGMVTYDSGGGSGTQDDEAHGIAIDSGNNIYVAGYQWAANKDWTIRKYDSGGVLDTTWGTNGMINYHSGGTQDDKAYDLVIDSNRNIYVVGYQQTYGYDWAVRKYDSGGVSDTTWGTNGMVTYDSGGGSGTQDDTPYSIGIDSSSSIYVVGYQTITNGQDWAVRKYDSGGVLDTTWGTNGMVTYDSGGGSGTQNDIPWDIAVDSGSNIYVAGEQNSTANGADWAVRKYDSGGVLDTTWGTNGMVTYNSGGANSDRAYDIILDSDRNIYVGGYKTTGSWYDLAVRVYNNMGALADGLTVGTSQICVYARLDVGSGATGGQTLDIEIANPSTEVTVSDGTVSPGTPIAIASTTTFPGGGPTLDQLLRHGGWFNSSGVRQPFTF